MPARSSSPTPNGSSRAGGDSRALRLVSILASGLPIELGTPEEPALYTVPVVFSRQVAAAEREVIEDPETARRLIQATGTEPGLTFTVEDRRLLIHNTSLRLLKDGLASAIGRMLQRIGTDILAEQDRVAASAEARLSHERKRVDLVAREAAEISFAAADDRSETAGGDTA
jgi:hypothetical protein